MPTRRNSRLPASGGTEIVTAPNLKEAYRKVRLIYGEDAAILGTRTVTMRSDNGLGQEKIVEITLADDASTGKAAPARTVGHARFRAPKEAVQAAGSGRSSLHEAISAELDRIDDLVAEISGGLATGRGAKSGPAGGTVGRVLAEAGTTPETIVRLVQRYEVETEGQFQEGPQLRQWLARQIPAADCDWDGFFGCHAFLGYSRPQRQELVLSTCERFRALGREILLLVVMPQNEGTVRRLQVEAARCGYDAAIIRNHEQLRRCEDHFDQYEAVVLELPDLDCEGMSGSTAVHDWLAGNAGFHRHLVVPLDGDLEDVPLLAHQARHWNCDWLAVSRPSRFNRTGKLFDILEKLPLPVSLTASISGQETKVTIARAGELLGEIMDTDRAGLASGGTGTAEAGKDA